MIYSQELKDRTFKAYGDDIGSGVVRRHELEEKVLAYYRRTTPYVIGALQQARKRGILTAGISSNPDSPLSHAVDIPIEMIVGPEFVTGSSRMKSGTGQKMILNMISTSVMIKLGRVKGNRMVNMQLSNQKLVDRGMRMIMEELQLDEKKAKQLLQKYGSVKKVLDIYNKK